MRLLLCKPSPCCPLGGGQASGLPAGSARAAAMGHGHAQQGMPRPSEAHVTRRRRWQRCTLLALTRKSVAASHSKAGRPGLASREADPLTDYQALCITVNIAQHTTAPTDRLAVLSRGTIATAVAEHPGLGPAPQQCQLSTHLPGRLKTTHTQRHCEMYLCSRCRRTPVVTLIRTQQKSLTSLRQESEQPCAREMPLAQTL